MAYSKSLAEGIRQYKETEEGRDHMSEAVAKYGNKREKEGIKLGKKLGEKRGERKNQLLNVKSLMDTMKLTLEQALDALKITEQKERQSIIKAVQRG